MARYKRFADTAENRLRVRLYQAVIIAEYAGQAALLLFFLFMVTLVGCIAGRLLGWPSWVSVFVKEYWIIIHIAMLVLCIGLEKYSNTLANISAQGRKADPDLDMYMSEYTTLGEKVALKASATDMRNIPGRIFNIFVSGAIFGAVVFGGIFS